MGISLNHFIFEKIKKILDDIILSSFIIVNDETKEILYYNLYLVFYEIRNGFYPEIFNNVDNKILNKIKKIKNIDYIKCACYDNSKSLDTIYIYNKNKNKLIMKSINFLNTTKRTNKNILQIDNHIANLLSYDKIKRNYEEAFDETKTLSISFIIYDFRNRNDIKKINILSYQSYKSNLIKNYEKLHKINNLPIFDRYKGLRCILEIDDIGI